MKTVIIYADEVTSQNWLVTTNLTLESVQVPLVHFTDGTSYNVETGKAKRRLRQLFKQEREAVSVIHPGQPDYVDPQTLACTPNQAICTISRIANGQFRVEWRGQTSRLVRPFGKYDVFADGETNHID